MAVLLEAVPGNESVMAMVHLALQYTLSNSQAMRRD
jgi:hypothetical protein